MLQVVMALAEAGASVRVRAVQGWTALHFSSRCLHCTACTALQGAEYCRYIIDCKYFCDLMTGTDCTALALYREGHVDCVKVLCSRGAPLDAKTEVRGAGEQQQEEELEQEQKTHQKEAG